MLSSLSPDMDWSQDSQESCDRVPDVDRESVPDVDSDDQIPDVGEYDGDPVQEDETRPRDGSRGSDIPASPAGPPRVLQAKLLTRAAAVPRAYASALAEL